MAFEPNLIWNEELNLWEHWEEDFDFIISYWTPEEYDRFMAEY